MNKTCISFTNVFKTILLDRMPEKKWVDRGSEFLIEHLNLFLNKTK